MMLRCRPGTFCRCYTGLLLLLFVSVSIATEDVHAQKNTANKYAIQLPDEWNKKAKLLSKIIYIIDTHIPELDTKELCLSCNADYKVAFKISAPKVRQVYFNQYGTTAYTVLYQFFAYMDVSEESGRIIHRLVLSDTSEVHGYKAYRANWFAGPDLSYSLDHLRNRQATDDRSPIALPPVQGSAYNERMRAAMAPDTEKLWKAVEKIIMTFKFSDE